MFGRISDLLAEKGRQVYTIRKAATICDAVREMNTKGAGSLLVVVEGRPVGILTERDILRRVIDVDRDPALTRVVEVMSADPLVIDPAMRVEEAMEIMTSRRFRHLPVVAGGEVIGIVSIGDIMRWVMMHQQDHIEHMTDYITGRHPA